MELAAKVLYRGSGGPVDGGDIVLDPTMSGATQEQTNTVMHTR